MKIHTPTTADDGGARLRIESVNGNKMDFGRVRRRNWAGRGTHFQHGSIARVVVANVGVAIKPFFAEFAAFLHLDEADIETCIFIAGEDKLAGDIDGPNHRVGFYIVRHDMP